MPDLPAGTVTFLFTDIEGSTVLLRRLGDARYRQLQADHHDLVRTAISAHGGTEVDAQSESFFVSFPTARSAMNCAIAIQRAVSVHPWLDGTTVRVRIGIHTGEAVLTATGYVGMDVHRAARVCAAGYGGQILLSHATYSLVRHELPQEVTLRDLGEHRLKDLQQPERIFQVVLPDLPSEFPPLRSLGVVPNNLPVQLTSFIGREREIAEIKTILDDSRLLTLTGPGGCGKTRLALQVAADLVDRFPDGIWFVELAAVSDPALLPQTVSAALGLLADRGRTTLNAVAEYLQERTALLILDTCEHLLPACVDLANAIIRTTKSGKILATSRERLDIPGTAVYPVPSLGLPDPRAENVSEEIKTSEAVRLFLDRVTMASASFSPTPEVAPALIQIVRRLDGIPLAIELAAAKAKVLSIPEIAERLRDRFRLLTGGSRTLPRQQTLRATVDWSHDLLSQRERILLRRLTVFSGGCGLDAVEGVCTRGDLAEGEILDLLTALVDKSLIVVDQSGPRTRYRLLDTIHEYGLEKLSDAGEAEALRTRHRNWFLAFAERVESLLYGPDESWMNRVEADHDNLRAALEWSMQRREAEAVLRTAVALMRFWEVRGYWSEGRRWLVAAHALGGAVPQTLRARALIAEGQLAQYQGEHELVETLAQQALLIADDRGDLSGKALNLLGGTAYYREDHEEASRLFEESLGHARRANDLRLIASCLLNLATIALHREEYEQARQLAHESLEAFRRVGERRGTAFVLNLLGVIEADLGKPASAEPLVQESLNLGRELGDRRSIAASLSHLGRVVRDQEDYFHAETLYKQSLAIRRDLADPRGVAIALAGLGITLGLSGRAAEGSRLLKESLKMRLDRRDRVGVAECLEGLGRLVGDPQEAATLLAAADAIRSAARSPLPPADRRLNDDRIGHLQRELGEVAFHAAWGEGAGMSFEKTFAYVLTLTGK